MIELLGFVFFINIIGCIVFVLDRQAANQGRKRVNQMLLVLCVALGGGPGALLARAPAPGFYGAPPLNPALLGVMGIELGIAVGIALSVMPIA